METTAEKSCKKCGKIKPLDKFPKCKRSRDRHKGRCYGCSYRARHYADLDASRAKRRATSNKYREVNRKLYLESKVQETARYHAARRRLPATLTAKEWQRIVAFYCEACAYCGAAANTQLFRCRIVPVSQGGGLTADNTVPACRRCSASKRDRVIRPLLMHNVGENQGIIFHHQQQDNSQGEPATITGPSQALLRYG